ncbi:MAG: hypothetical protein AVDCRST_MAG42-163 [uncultured Chthoniobacterales bacterium]|uniref:Activator of Hsp90 ATPase homologue 1/2-like C-terminal domain-containing protein n=1 Tax=uncultured Chthoniobacterales bacterium TaxID=1836801 RepID=A0A6J4H956_9BACT|nr:MAG: hypothetical protein AVDCRST_MAG42-163 [uncultured Chthoniobacterales bacterium]
MSSEPNVVVTVTHRFDASAERVFEAWLDPEQVRNWMTVSGSMKALSRVRIDPQLGGSFAFVDVRDGEKVEHVGNYLEIERPHRLAFTWRVKPEEESSTVSIDIVAQGSGCEATLQHELAPEWADYADRCKAAWAKMLGGIAATVNERGA